ELHRAGLGGFKRRGHGPLQQEAGIVHIAAESGRFAAVQFLVGVDIFQGDFLGRIAVGNIVGNQHYASAQDSAFDFFAAQLDELIERGPVGLVDRTLVVHVDQGDFRQDGGAAGGGDQDGV